MALFARSMVVAGCIFIICTDPVSAGDSASSVDRKWGPWSEIGGYAANRDYARHGEATLWAPLLQSSVSLFFTDIRAKLYSDDQQAGNFALGYRHMLSNGWNLGVWGAYDRRWTENSNVFGQFAGGFEALSSNWDLRINAYFPLEKEQWVSTTTTGSSDVSLELVDDSLYMISGPQTRTDVTELAFRGVDAEIGMRVPMEYFDPSKAPSVKGVPQHDLRIYLGGYYLESNRYSDEMIGPRLRAEWRINDILSDWEGSRLTFETAYRHDDVRDDDVRVGALLRIPLGGDRARRDLTGQEERMLEGLKRDTDVVTHRLVESSSTPGAREHVEDTATGVDLLKAVVVENGGSIDDAIATTGSNSLIIALGGGTDFDGVEMEANQTLLGGGGTLQVRGLETGTVANYTAPGIQPTISGSIQTANNSHVSNFTIATWAEGNGISVDSDQTVVIDHVTSDGVAGVYIGGDDANVTVQSSTFTGNDGIWIIGNNNTLVASGNTFNTRGSAVYVYGDQNSLTISGNTFSDSIDDYLFKFSSGSSEITDGSVGNVDNADSRTEYCQVYSATFTGEIGFPDMTISVADCSEAY